jgi:NAD-dependent deacetylase
MRPGVVLFGELMPERMLFAAERAAATCDVMLLVGTSGEVHPTAELPTRARKHGD